MYRFTKTILSLLLAALLVLSMVGCGAESGTPAGTKAPATEGNQNTPEPDSSEAGRSEPKDTVEPKTATDAPESGSAGELVFFGACEQDGNAENGREPIEWIVLERNGDELLLLSRCALDCRQFELSDGSYTWDGCTLRQWLNGAFYQTAFLPEEQESILVSHVPADPNPQQDTDPGSETEDRVFLLSIQELLRYLPEPADRLCEPTAFTKSLGVTGQTSCIWWLRTPGNRDDCGSFCTADGEIDYDGKLTHHDDYGVRPALRVSEAALNRCHQTLGPDVMGQRPAIFPETSMDPSALKTAQVGALVRFGSYEQDNDPANGAEPIEWIVLDRDDSGLLLLSKYCLESHLFDGANLTCGWANSSIRSWLNVSFYGSAFSAEERALVREAVVPAHPNPENAELNQGEDTLDRVFLLSAEEAARYLPTREALACQTTAYSKAQAERAGAKIAGTMPWWLRTWGMNNNSYTLVRGNGGVINYKGTMPGDHNPMVRPAIWVDPEN